MIFRKQELYFCGNSAVHKQQYTAIVVSCCLLSMRTSQAPIFQPNPALYPFAPHRVRVSGGFMHYIDEGKGAPLLFVHGTPTWSFLYRHYIRALAPQYRCIAPDHIGFGLSDKPATWDYTLQSHSHNIEQLVDALGLEQITLIVHDFGGPIALPFALRYPEKIRRIVLFNTWMWETLSDPATRRVSALLHSSIGRLLYLRFNISPRILLKKAFYKREMLSAAVHQHYTGVFPHRDDRVGLLMIGRELTGASDWMESQWQQLHRIVDKPALLLWGKHDPVLREQHLHKWQQALPSAHTVQYDCGHFIQEEQPEESLYALASFLQIS